MGEYRPDLAHIHDQGFGHVAESAAVELLSELDSLGHTDGLVVDLGCGSGILAKQVSDAGFDLLGIDQSLAMVNLAKKHVPTGKFQVGSFLDARLPCCLAVTAVGEVFNYLFDANNTKSARALTLQRIADALLPGGLLMFDVACPGRVPGKGTVHKLFEGKEWTVIVTTTGDKQLKTLSRRIISFRRVGKLYRRDEEVHSLRLITPTEIKQSLRKAGFRVQVLSRYEQFLFPPGYAGFLARKP